MKGFLVLGKSFRARRSSKTFKMRRYIRAQPGRSIDEFTSMILHAVAARAEKDQATRERTGSFGHLCREVQQYHIYDRVRVDIYRTDLPSHSGDVGV